MITKMVGVIEVCPVCGQRHVNPDVFYLDDDALEGCMVICPTEWRGGQGRFRYFALQEVVKREQAAKGLSGWRDRRTTS